MRSHCIGVWTSTLLVVAALRVAAQEYVIDWCSFDSGVGVIGDGTYEINGTVGAWEAGHSECTLGPDVFALEAGFWPGPAVSVLYGLDVSHFQGTVDWGQVAGAGKLFA